LQSLANFVAQTEYTKEKFSFAIDFFRDMCDNEGMNNYVMKRITYTAVFLLAALLLCACQSPKINISDRSQTDDAVTDVADESSAFNESTVTTAAQTSSEDTAVLTGGTSPDQTEPSSADTQAEIVTVPGGQTDPPAAESVAGITDLAISLIGEPFLFGGDAPGTGFDSSGFIYYVLRSNGYVAVPRGLNDQTGFGTQISGYDDLQAGDIVFFSTGGARAEFGGIYIGGGSMITCQDEGQTVKEVSITSSFYRDSFFCATRVA
jgi:cell wall-associated NlpC family hydrolase